MEKSKLDPILENLVKKIRNNSEYQHLNLLNYYLSEVYDNGESDVKRMITLTCLLHHYRPEEITEIMIGITEHTQLIEPLLDLVLDLNSTEQEPRYKEIKYAREAHILCEADEILREVKSTNSTKRHSQAIAKINELEKRLSSSRAKIFFNARKERIEKEISKEY